jgi:UDP-3-O-[3-hydroxymyristoyl] glucosamine N-acyltransferase
MNRFYPTSELKPGVHPTAVVGNEVHMGGMAYVGPHAVVGDASRLGVACSIGAGCVVGKRVSLGEGCILHPNVTVYDNVDIGRSTIIHSGAVIGSGRIRLRSRERPLAQVSARWDASRSATSSRSAPTPASTAPPWGSRRSAKAPSSTTWSTWDTTAVLGVMWWLRRRPGFQGGVVVEDYAVIGGQVGIGDKARIESRATIGSGRGDPHVEDRAIRRDRLGNAGAAAAPAPRAVGQPRADFPSCGAKVAEIKRRLAELEGKH